jgi:hypothetical protein
MDGDVLDQAGDTRSSKGIRSDVFPAFFNLFFTFWSSKPMPVNFFDIPIKPTTRQKAIGS